MSRELETKFNANQRKHNNAIESELKILLPEVM